MCHMKILIVEDYQKINDLLALFARQDKHFVEQAKTAEEALEKLSVNSFDAILLDLMLPGMQGEEFISKIRMSSDVYIIVISAKIDVQGRIDVINMGADDYVIKPFSVEELMAKLKNLEKRLIIDKPIIRSFNHGDLLIHPMSREVKIGGHVIDLTKYEYDILLHLLEHPNIVFSREAIIEACFSDSDAYDRVIDAFIKNIRKKIDHHLQEGSYIRTHYGVGYQFVGESDDKR